MVRWAFYTSSWISPTWISFLASHRSLLAPALLLVRSSQSLSIRHWCLSLTFISNMSSSPVGSSWALFFISPFPLHFLQHLLVLTLSFLTGTTDFKVWFLLFQHFPPTHMFHPTYFFPIALSDSPNPHLLPCIVCLVLSEQRWKTHWPSPQRTQWDRDAGTEECNGEECSQKHLILIQALTLPSHMALDNLSVLACTMGIMAAPVL